jgi:flagellar biogenesis protein FliO
MLASRRHVAGRPMARRLSVPGAEPRGLELIGRHRVARRTPVVAAVRRWATPSHLAMTGVAAVLTVVAAIGAFGPAPVSGAGSVPTAGSSAALATSSAVAASTAAASQVGAAWGGSSGSLDVFDLLTKGGLVLVLLFITLRVLGRMQGAGPKREGRLNVLESRTLASKASLHLIAIGDRRLVVGLTPSGMVALAEMDASEIEQAQTEDSPAGDEAPIDDDTTAARRARAGQASPQFAATLNTLMAPIDRVTDRLAGFVGGGRVR